MVPHKKKSALRSRDDLEALTDAVERLHRARASFVRSIEVDERFEGATVWRGRVSQFDLTGHPTAMQCYAWSEPVEGGSRRRYIAVLHEPPVDTPAKAVRASIVASRKT